MRARLRVIVFVAGFMPATVLGQTVRGTVKDRATGEAGSGAVVMLERAVSDSAVQERGALTDGNGAYSIVAWGRGRIAFPCAGSGGSRSSRSRWCSRKAKSASWMSRWTRSRSEGPACRS